MPVQQWTAAILLLLLLATLYAHIGFKLIYDWAVVPDFSHGFLIPFFIGYLLWDKRERIAATPLRPGWAGLIPLVLALLTLLIGVFGADLFLSRISFVLLATGLVWTFAGAGMVKVLRLPLAGMLLAIPLPAILLNQLTLPLQFLASAVASTLLPLGNVPVVREGNIIQLPSMQLEVAEACSGIRSLMSLFTCAVIYGYFVERSNTRRSILILASLPIAVAANAFRIVGTGLCVQYWNPQKALGFFHEFSGWLMFVLSLVCLSIIHKTLQRARPDRLVPA